MTGALAGHANSKLTNMFWIVSLSLAWVAPIACCWLSWQLLRQNGRILLRLEELEKRFDEFEFADEDSAAESASAKEAPIEDNGDARANHFRERSLARSKIKRDGLKAGTLAPSFRLPRVDGRGELSLEELRGKQVLLVFSSPHCGPCNTLAPELEKFHRAEPEIQVVMITRGEPSENRAKIKEHHLTFPVVLQQQWEISRLYAMFATPIAYLIDGTGIVAHDVAIGTDAILQLVAKASRAPTALVPSRSD